MRTVGIVLLATLAVPLTVTRENLLARTLTPQVQSADAKPAETAVLKEGAEVSLKFAQSLTSRAAVAGQPVELVLAEDLKVQDHLVVKQGARVLGTVTSGKESEKKRQEAKFLAIRVNFLQVGANRIVLRGEKAAEGKRNKDAMVVGTIFFGVSGLIATSGKHYVIPEGAPLKAYVDEDIELPVLPN